MKIDNFFPGDVNNPCDVKSIKNSALSEQFIDSLSSKLEKKQQNRYEEMDMKMKSG